METQLQRKINRKSCVAFRMEPTPMTLNDLEGHFCCLKSFWLTYLWKSNKY